MNLSEMLCTAVPHRAWTTYSQHREYTPTATTKAANRIRLAAFMYRRARLVPTPALSGDAARRRQAWMLAFSRISRASAAVSDGVLPTLTPAASRASFFAAAVPAEPETIAPAWPMVLPSGAVKPAT